jgi:DNA repair protein RecN (Recombination protein N)
MADQGLDIEGDHLICRRELTLSKTSVRSRSYLNGSQINKPQMEDLRQLLVEITAQGQTVQVGSPDLQRQWLDEFGGDPILTSGIRCSKPITPPSQAKRKLEARRRAEQERLDQLEELQQHQKELDQAQLDDPEELETLAQENQRLSHTVELQQNSYQVYQILYESDAGAATGPISWARPKPSWWIWPSTTVS